MDLDVAIARDGTREIWRRRFGNDECMTSTLLPSRNWPDAFDERLGPARLTFALETDSDGLRWRAREVRLFGLRAPLGWFRGVEAGCGERNGRYVFDVRVRLPLIGLLVAYSGWLEIVADE